MRFAICDDMPVFLAQLNEIIRKSYPDSGEPIEIDEFESGEDFLADFSVGKYAAVILDVQMKGLTGIQTAHEIRKTDKDVVIAFHTSYDRLELNGYSVGDYIHMKKGQSFEMYQSQFSMIFRSCIRKKAVVRLADNDIQLCRILYFQECQKGTCVYTDTETIDLSVKLSEIEKNQQLTNFVKTHQKYYINTFAIRYIRDSSVSLKNGDVVPLSWKYRKNVEQEYVRGIFELH